MANTYTTNLNLKKPTRGDVDWDDEINENLDSLDSIISADHNADGSHKNTVNIGDGQNSVDKKISANTGEANEPYISYDVTNDRFVISDNGTDEYPLLPASGNVLEVAKSGKKYSTISSALSAAQSGEVVLVHPGVYEETLTVPADVHLVGVDRQKTIVQQLNCPAGPINIMTLSDNSSVKNLTINGSGQSNPPAIVYGIYVSEQFFTNVIRDVDIIVAAGVATGIQAPHQQLDLTVDGCTLDVYSTLGGQVARGISFGATAQTGGTLTVNNCNIIRSGEGTHSCGNGHIQKITNTRVKAHSIGLNVDSVGGSTTIHGCHIEVAPEFDDLFGRGIASYPSSGNDVSITATCIVLDMTGADSGMIASTCAALYADDPYFTMTACEVVIKGLSGVTCYGLYASGTNDHYLRNSAIRLDNVGTQYSIYENGSGTVYVANLTDDITKRFGSVSPIDHGHFSRLVIPSGTTEPASPVEGDLFLDTDAGANGTLKIYSNSAWRTIAAL
jgi:hypothetical protein